LTAIPLLLEKEPSTYSLLSPIVPQQQTMPATCKVDPTSQPKERWLPVSSPQLPAVFPESPRYADVDLPPSQLPPSRDSSLPSSFPAPNSTIWSRLIAGDNAVQDPDLPGNQAPACDPDTAQSTWKNDQVVWNSYDDTSLLATDSPPSSLPPVIQQRFEWKWVIMDSEEESTLPLDEAATSSSQLTVHFKANRRQIVVDSEQDSLLSGWEPYSSSPPIVRQQPVNLTRSFVLTQAEEGTDSDEMDETLSINSFLDDENQKMDSNMTDKDKSTVSCLTDEEEESDYDRADEDEYLSYGYDSIEKQDDFLQNSPISDNSAAMEAIMKDPKQQRESSQLTAGLRDIQQEREWDSRSERQRIDYDQRWNGRNVIVLI